MQIITLRENEYIAKEKVNIELIDHFKIINVVLIGGM